MKIVLAGLLSLALLSACAATPKTADASAPASTTFILVRHAEKVPDGSDDPALTAAGERRAQALAKQLADVALSAVYSTASRRTQQTATPAARGHGLTVITYDAKQPASDLATQLQQDRAGQTVLIVGHSNTVPGIAAALCRCEVAPMSEAEYDRLTTVRIAADGTATLQESKQQ